MAVQGVAAELQHEWAAWSRQSEKFRAGECERVWRGFKPDKARSLGLGSLIKWAREDSGDSEFGRPNRGAKEKRPFDSLQAAIDFAVGAANGEFGGLWTYHRADGSEHFWVVRINRKSTDARGKKQKEFRPIRRSARGFELGDPPGSLPLYRLHLLPKTGLIQVHEGEKTTEVALEFGYAATTSAHGAQSPGRTDWSPLAGREVRIFPDNDPEGIKYAIKVGEILEKLDPPAIVTVVRLPELPDRGDLADFAEHRRSSGKTDQEIRAEIDVHMASAETLASYAGAHLGASPVFQDPIPLPDELPNVEAFDFDLMPIRLAPWARDIAERMQCAADYLFATIMVALAAVLGRRVGIRPKRFDSWLVVANLWGAAIGRPGILKTPAVQEGLKPLHRLEQRAKEAFEKDKEAHRAAQIMAEARYKVRERDLRKAVEEGGGEDLAKEMAADEPHDPVRRRYVLNDSTVEKLGEILNQNPNGVLSFRDELVGLLRSLDKEGQEGARGFYLQAWNGDGGYTYDRIGRGTVDIEAAIISVFGSIQPGPLGRYLLSGAATGQSDDGLIQRFQVIVWPDQSKEWVNHDREPNREAREVAYGVFQALNELTAESTQAERDVFDLEAIPFLRFADDAQVEFDAWRARLERRLRTGEEDEAFESHLAKYRSLVPSLALIYHLVDVGHGPVGLESLRRAIRASKYLESHARRVYAATISADLAAAHALAKKLIARKVTNPFSLRDVYQHGWTLLKKSEDVGKAVAVLIDHNWLVEDQSQRERGAPKTSYIINPKIWELPEGGPGRTGRSPSPDPPENSQAAEGATGKTGRSPDQEPESGDDRPGDACTTGRSESDGLVQVLPVLDESPDGNPSAPVAPVTPPPKDILDLVTETFGGSVIPDPSPPRPATPPRPARPSRTDPTPTLGFDGEEEVPYD